MHDYYYYDYYDHDYYSTNYDYDYYSTNYDYSATDHHDNSAGANYDHYTEAQHHPRQAATDSTEHDRNRWPFR